MQTPLSLKKKLINGLSIIPESWSLVPVKQKRPYRAGWQEAEPIPHEKLKELILKGDLQYSNRKQKYWKAYPDGYGVRTGECSGRLLAIDIDGPTALTVLREMSNGNLPETVSWTSGKVGRKQMLYRIPPSLQERLSRLEFTHVAVKEYQGLKCEGDEQLDFRSNRCQSVLPPSRHPQTGAYRWINSPENVEVAEAPQWIEDWLSKHCNELERKNREHHRRQAEATKISARQLGVINKEVITPLDLLNAIDPTPLDWYEWRNCLLAAHNAELSEQDVRRWSATSPKHTDRGFSDVWEHIKGKGVQQRTAGTLWYYAKSQGWEPPKQNNLPKESSVDLAFIKQQEERQRVEDAQAKLFQDELKQKQRDRFLAETIKIQKELNTLGLEPTIEATGRYIPQGLLTLPHRSGIIIVDATMGTGKTSSTAKSLVQQHRKLYPGALQWLFTPRNLLSLQSGDLLGLPHRSTLGFGRYGTKNRGSSCFESIGAIDFNNLSEPPIIIIDEAGQAFKQILYGNTCKGYQAFVVQRIRQLFRRVAELGGWIVILEDGLTKLESEFVADASGMEVVEYLKFTKEVTTPRSYQVYDSATNTWDEILIRLDRGENIIVASDSQRWLTELERWLANQGIDGVFITSETSQEDWAIECVKDPTRWIYTHRPTVFGYSPSMCSGVSVDDPDGYFDAMAFHITHLEPREAKQLCDRLRTDVPRFGFVKERAAAEDDLCSGSRPDLILRDLRRNRDGVAKLIHFVSHVEQKSDEDIDLVQAWQQVDEQWDDPTTDLGFYLKHYSRYKARENHAKVALADNLMQIWQGQGHDVSFLRLGRIDHIADEREEIREELDTEAASEWAEIDTHEMSPSEARDILGSLKSTREQRLQAQKCLKEDKLPGTPLNDPNFVLKAIIRERGRFLKNTELLWMARHPEAAKQINRWNWLNAFTGAAKHSRFVPIHQLSVVSAQAKLLNECPLKPFIDGEVTDWDNNTPEGIAVHQWALLHARQFRRYLRLTIKEEHEPVKTVNKLLRKLGFEVEKVSRKGSRGERECQYAITNREDTDRELILKALTERFLKSCETKGEAPTEPQLSQATTHPLELPSIETPSEWSTPEALADVKTWWELADSPDIKEEIRRLVPPDILRRAIA